MSRITAPTPTRGRAPSHSPPDMHYAPGIHVARALGWFSIGLGLAEILAPRTMAELTGVRRPGLIWAYGIREIATGIGILASAQPAAWMWARVAGDAVDMATLGEVIANGSDKDQRRAIAAAVAVAGVTALDATVGAQLTTASMLEG